MRRFLELYGILETTDLPAGWCRPSPDALKVVRVTEPVTALSAGFRFARPWKGLEVVPKAGTLIATDGDKAWHTPYDDCVMVMPSMAHVKPGNTMLRLGRYE